MSLAEILNVKLRPILVCCSLGVLLPKLYGSYSISTAVFSNSGGYAAMNISLSMEIEPYTTGPRECPVRTRLEPGASLTVDLYALFSEKQILMVTEDTKTFGEIRWKYTMNGEEKSGKNVVAVQILSRNAMT